VSEVEQFDRPPVLGVEENLWTNAPAEIRLRHIADIRRMIEEQIAAGNTSSVQELARELVRDAVDWVGGLCGTDVLRLAQENPLAGNDPLGHIAGRVILALPILVSPADDFGQELLFEIAAVASGDHPKMFAKRAGEKSKYRISRHQLEALKWEKFLEGRGQSAVARQNRISSAFNLTWDAIRRWRSECSAALGAAYVDEALANSRTLGELNLADRADLWTGALRHPTVELAAAEYWQEKRSNISTE